MRKQNDNAKEVSPEREAELKRDARRVLAEARRAMIQRQPFTGAVAMNMDVVPVRDERMGTACTDGRTIYFDIDFLSGLSPEDRMFIFGHEVWHSLLQHLARAENRDPEIMNVAEDLEVNQLLVKDGFCAPSHALMPDKLGLPPDLCAEQYYDLLTQNAQNQSRAREAAADRTTSGQFDVHARPGDNPADKKPGGQNLSDKYGRLGRDKDFRPDDPRKSVERIREAVFAAAQVMERTRGSLPGHVKGLVEALLRPELDWRERLQQFVTRTCGGENRTWSPPNRRHAHGGVYLQSRKGEKIKVFAGLDVSGSTQSDIPKFLAELNGLVKTFGKFEITVAQCDTEIRSCRTYTDDDPLDLENEKFEIEGCGGTELRPLFDKVSEMADEGDAPDAVVILTDGYVGRFSEDEDPGLPVMWLVTKDGQEGFAGFGETVRFKSTGREAA